MGARFVAYHVGIKIQLLPLIIHDMLLPDCKDSPTLSSRHTFKKLFLVCATLVVRVFFGIGWVNYFNAKHYFKFLGFHDSMVIINECNPFVIWRRYSSSFHLQEFLIVLVLESKSAKCSEIKLTLTVSTLLSKLVWVISMVNSWNIIIANKLLI